MAPHLKQIVGQGGEGGVSNTQGLDEAELGLVLSQQAKYRVWVTSH